MSYTQTKTYRKKYYESNKEKIKATSNARRKRLSRFSIHKDVKKLLAYAKPNLETGKTVLKEYASPLQYRYVHICGKNYLVHRLVMMQALQSFIPKNKEIDHLNSVRSDNRIVNLQLVTHAENIRRSWNSGKRRKQTPEERKAAQKRYNQTQRKNRKIWVKAHPEKIKQYNKTTYLKRKLMKLVQDIRKIGETK